ncbi:MAG TPA: hypothetical protein VGT41_06680 [Candidatus Babeliales bacterium]|nr:hypothetical protein [Candidatus Babeliales bacterium]
MMRSKIIGLLALTSAAFLQGMQSRRVSLEDLRQDQLRLRLQRPTHLIEKASFANPNRLQYVVHFSNGRTGYCTHTPPEGYEYIEKRRGGAIHQYDGKKAQALFTHYSGLYRGAVEE